MFLWVEARDGGRGGQGQFNARFAHNSSHLHLIAPYLLAAGHFCKMRFWKCVKSYLSWGKGILCIFAIQQRFVVFIFLGVEICQIAWFDGCISVPSIDIERPMPVVFPNFRKYKNCTKKIIVYKRKREKRFVGADLDAYYFEVFQIWWWNSLWA